MAESSTGTSSTTGDPLADFGANEWLVDEMYQRYQRDPNSVDKVWWDFFKQNAPGGNGSSTNGSSSADKGADKGPKVGHEGS